MRATNPQTGEEIELINGKWVPVPPAKMADRVASTISNKSKEVNDRDFSFRRMASNFPGSAAQAGRDIWQAVSNPIDTLQGLGKTAIGAGQLLYPGEQSYEPYARAVGEHFSDRYGGLEQTKQTFMEDPYGAVSDVAGLLSGVGSLPRMGKVGRMGSMLDPTNLATRGVGKTGMNIPGVSDMPANLYDSAAKFYKKYDAPVMSQRALDLGIPPTEAGMQKMKGMANAIDDQITEMINNSVKSGESIDTSSVLTHIKELEKDMTNFNLDAATNKSQIQAVVDNFNEMVQSQGKQKVSAAEMQKFKREIYNSINWDRGQQIGGRATEEARKAIAKGAKESLEKVMPEIKDLNLQWGDIIELQDALEGPASRIGRRDIIGLGSTSKGILGGIVGDIPGAVTGFIIGLMDNPSLKVKIAMDMERIKKLDVSDANKRVMAIETLRSYGAMQNEEQQNAL